MHIISIKNNIEAVKGAVFSLVIRLEIAVSTKVRRNQHSNCTSAENVFELT